MMAATEGTLMATAGQVQYLEKLAAQQPERARAAKAGYGIERFGDLTRGDADRVIKELRGEAVEPKEGPKIGGEKERPAALARKPREQEDLKALDLRDEKQVLAEIKGALIEEFVYSFAQGGREVVGLSYAGVKAVAQSMGGIKVGMPEIQDCGDAWLVRCLAEDTVRRIQMPGVGYQRKTMQTKTGETPDDFAPQKATSKAVRNAIRAVIPEAVAVEMMKRFLQAKRGGA